GGAVCFAKDGRNKFHAIFGGGPSYIVHPSTLATALVALGASVRLEGSGGATRDVALGDFFTLPQADYERENVLREGEILTEVRLPALPAGTASAYVVAKERAVYDWPLGEVAIVLGIAGSRVARATVVLGAAAPVPWRARGAEQALIGKAVGLDSARAA